MTVFEDFLAIYFKAGLELFLFVLFFQRIARQCSKIRFSHFGSVVPIEPSTSALIIYNSKDKI
jgi:hypothetical protein